MIISNWLASLKYHKIDIWSLPLIFGYLVLEKSAHNTIYTSQYNLKNSYGHLISSFVPDIVCSLSWESLQRLIVKSVKEEPPKESWSTQA